ncbi:MAG TPA: hypothetical protein ENN46_03350 [Candidatus Woesearchaeota archaeon]|nr:hypothetical protein [Candidatus Woesearchaeota archaeon]
MLKSELEIFREKVKDGFAKIKADFEAKNKEIRKIKEDSLEAKKDYIKIKDLLLEIKKDLEEIKSNRPTSIVKSQASKNSPEKKNSKILVLNRLFKLLSSGKTKTNELKNQLVNAEKLCSKATFYRYVDELIEKNKVAGIKTEEGSFLMLNNVQEQKDEGL